MASDYEGESWEAFVKSLPETTDSDKLGMLAMELKRHFVAIKGYAEVGKYQLKNGTASTEEIINYLEKIADAAADASKITHVMVAARQK